MHEGLKGTLAILGHRLKAASRWTRDYDRELPRIWAYGGELNQVWTNLIVNALDAMGGRGSCGSARPQAGDDIVHVEIADDGPGIPAEIQARILEPFFTTKPHGEGTGLGLDTV